MKHFSALMAAVQASQDANITRISSLTNQLNELINKATVATIQDAINIYESFQQIASGISEVETAVNTTGEKTEELYAVLLQLPVSMPDADMAWSLRPSGLQAELQMGYKSNRGFVLTSAGMMFFEQVQGADFLLCDVDGNYVVAQGNDLHTGTKAESTVWTGKNLGGGNYLISSKNQQKWLAYSGTTVNSNVVVTTQSYVRRIEEGIDELQAFLNLLAEEAEEGESGGELPTDTLVVELPTYDPDRPAPTTPFVFPKVPYPIWVTGGDNGGYWTIPNPNPGQPRPENFHPIYIPWGSHVIIDDITFRDIVGGHHVIYYVMNGLPTQRYIFNVFGSVHFATGSVVKGYFDPTWQFTDDRLPGAVVYVDPAARFYIDGGRFENVIFRMNNVVNTYVTANIVNNIYIYVPTAWRNEGFRIVQPWGSYRFTLSDLRRIVLVGAAGWTVDADADGYASLLDIEKMGDVNNDGHFDVADVQSAARMRAGLAAPTVRADLNIDGRLTSADLKALVNLIAGKK